MKKGMMKAVLLAVILVGCVSLLQVRAMALTEGDLTYVVSNGEITITDCSESVSGTLTIPDTIGGSPVTAIGGNAFRNCEDLTGIIIPATVTSIGESAFSGCSSLTDVYFNGDLATWCGIRFDANPMMYADKLYLNGKQLSGEVTIPEGVTTIPHGTFKNCTGLTSVIVADSVKSIAWRVFQGCTKLTSVTFGSGVTEIGGYAFYGCTSLKTVTIPDSVTALGDAAFSGCTKLQTVTLPSGLASIGWSVFADCSSLNYNVYDNAKYLGNQMNPYLVLVKCTSDTITQCQIHPDTKLTSNSVFFGCASLTDIVIPQGVLSINGGMFANCTNLKSITIPGSVTSIDSNAFQNCSSLDHVLYTGTQEQWDTMTIGTSNAYLTGATRHYDCTGEELVDGICVVCNPPAALGDANGDGFVDAYDAALVKKYSVGSIAENGLNLDVLDLDGDNVVDAYDAALIQKHSIGAITKFPVEVRSAT